MAEIEKKAEAETVDQAAAKKAAKAEKAAAKAKKAAAKADSAKSKDKQGSKDKEKKNIFQRIGLWFKDLRKEFKKVVWPDRKKVTNNTIVVLLIIIIGSVVIGLIDTGLLHLMKFLMGLSS